MSEPKHLHPISIVATILKQLKEMIIPIIAIFFLGEKGSENGNPQLWIPVIIICLVLVYSVVHWWRYTYRIEEGELRIESGVIVRKKRYIPFERIHSLDQSEGILHRVFGLVKLKIETAASGGVGKDEAEAVFAAISKEEAKQFAEILTAVKNSAINPNELPNEKQNEIYKITMKELVLLATTSGGVGVIISAVIAFLTQFDELINFETFLGQFERLLANSFVFISLLVFMGFFIAWVLALIGTMFKYANFTVIKSGDDFVITRGLIEKRKITVPLKRIQAIRISQNILRQPLGYGTVLLETAGGSVENTELSKVAILPMVKNTDIVNILKKWLPDYHLDVELQPAPKRAAFRYLVKGWLIVLPIAVILPLFIGPWGWLACLLLFPVSFLQYLSYRDVGWGIEDEQLTLRFRGLSKHFVFMKKGKIQSLRIDESYFQRKKQLCTILASVKSGIGGGGGRVVDLNLDAKHTIFAWFSREKNRQPES